MGKIAPNKQWRIDIDVNEAILVAHSSDEPVPIRRTFLFTDIEGSYRQWERHPEAMPRALAVHDAIVQAAVAENGGRVFKTVGDAVCAVFEGPSDGVRAAVQAQRALYGTRWSEIGLAQPLTVRMALQMGEAEERDGDYAGLVLNRISRLLRAGHGGQVLVAPSVAAELERRPLCGVRLRDLGERRLRDVPGAHRIHQLEIEGLPTTFPPLETLDTIAHNLPVALNACLDREAEQAQIRHLLLDTPARLVTLHGPGGIGKTRLALHAAMQLIDAFPGGIWFIDLSGVRDSSSIPAAISPVLGSRIEPGGDAVASLAEQIGERPMLLMLDNCEQIVADVALFVAALLPQAAGVRVLVTSRIPLQIRGEQRVEIGPLPVEKEQLAGPAVQLFMERAQQIRPSFEMNDANRDSIFEICYRVDGIPLALELAAARVAVLSPEALRNRLSSRLTVLTSTSPDLPERHQTLRAAIAWSYALLTDEEQVAFRQLSVFQGGWSFAGAQAVLGMDELAAMDVLTSLRDKSLIRLSETEDGEPRYSMLETIQEFGSEQLGDDEAPAVRDRHAEFYLAFSQDAEPFLEGGPLQHDWLLAVDRHIANLRAALHYDLLSGKASEALELCINLWFYWASRGLANEGQTWFERAQALAEQVDPSSRAAAFRRLGNLCIERGQLLDAETLFRASLEIERSLSSVAGVAQSLVGCGMVAGMIGRWQEEFDLLQEALLGCRQLGSARGLAVTLLNLAHWARNQGDADETLRIADEIVPLQESLQDHVGLAFTQVLIARARQDLGQLDVAADLLLGAEETFMSAQVEDGLLAAWMVMASIELQRDHAARASALIERVVEGYATRGDKAFQATALEVQAAVCVATGEGVRGAGALGSAHALRVTSHFAIPPADLAVVARTRQHLEDDLGAVVFQTWFEEGRQKQMRAAWPALSPLRVPATMPVPTERLHST